MTQAQPWSFGGSSHLARRLSERAFCAWTDGGCLLFNLYVDVAEGKPLIFPNDKRVLKDRFAKALFRMSSLLPPHAVEGASRKGYEVRPGARGSVFNAGIEAIADFFDIGTVQP